MSCCDCSTGTYLLSWGLYTRIQQKPEPESTTARSSHDRGGGIGGFICTTEKAISKSNITPPPPL